VDAGSGEHVEQLPAGTEKKTPEERKALLAQAVANWVHGDWRVESQTDFQAVMVKGHRTNHVLHLILTLVTLGIWAMSGFSWSRSAARSAPSSRWTSTATHSLSAEMPTALDNGQRSPRKLLRNVVARLLGRTFERSKDPSCKVAHPITSREIRPLAIPGVF
jgi:hypothetical protein